MNRQFTATGATVEEAIENACKELGVSPEDVTPEVLRFPKKGFLGLGKTTAEVRVTVLGEEEPKKAAPKAPAKKAAPAPKPEKPAAVPQSAPVEKTVPAKTEKVEVAKQPESKPVEKAPETPVVEAKPEAAAPVVEEIPLEQLQPKMDIAKEYLTAIFEKMGIADIELRMEPAENRTVMIHLEGAGIGTIIGKRGETLDAIQYLVSLAANRSEGDYVRFTINAGNYREKREETLRALAQRMARKVLKTGRPAALEPMNPYERRIIHAVVTDIDGVFSKSTGEEPNRKVVIKPTAKPASGGRRDGGSRRSGGKGGRSRNAAPREQENVSETASVPAAEQNAAPAEKPVLDDNIKLYSKIEL